MEIIYGKTAFGGSASEVTGIKLIGIWNRESFRMPSLPDGFAQCQKKPHMYVTDEDSEE